VLGSRLAFRATMCRGEGDLEACWNRILTIFDPFTFLHSQGQKRQVPIVRFECGPDNTTKKNQKTSGLTVSSGQHRI